MSGQVWEKNCREVAQHIQRNCETLEDAWSLVGDVGDKALKEKNGKVLSTGTLSDAIGELCNDAVEEVDGGDTQLVRETSAWSNYEKYFTREANIRSHIGKLTVRGDHDDDNLRIDS